MKNLKRKSQRGITLIEMLVVVVIIGLVVGTVGSAFAIRRFLDA